MNETELYYDVLDRMGEFFKIDYLVNPETPKKECTKCNTYKPVTEFRRRTKNSDGFDNQCKQCTQEYYNLRCNWQLAVRRKRLTATYDEIEYLYLSDPNCHYCRKPLAPNEVSLDHKQPLCGEINNLDKTSIQNIAISCRDCNYLKHTRSEQEFFAFLSIYRERLNNISWE